MMRISTKSAVVAVAAVAALGFGGWTWMALRERAEARDVQSLVAAAMAYNVKLIGLDEGTIEFHRRSSGVTVACGMTFTALSAPHNSEIVGVAPGRIADWCDERGDIVYVKD